MGGRVNRAQSHNDWSRGGGGSALALILALHAGALWGLMQIESVREAVQDAVPIMVGLVTLAPPDQLNEIWDLIAGFTADYK
jgi:hypothetical protein